MLHIQSPRARLPRLALAGLVALLVLPFAAAAQAQEAAVDRLMAALRIGRVIEVMREEGLAHGDELAAEMLPDGAGALWQRELEKIYDTEAMARTVREGFEDGLEGADIAPVLEFFAGPEGQRLVGLEISAREALMDPDVEEAARERFRQLEAQDDPRFRLVQEFVRANDLVEANVEGALNATYQFYIGLSDGGAMDIGEQEILAQVWQTEAETRADTREWLYAFLLMAYQPVPDAVLQDYIALSRTPGGQAMNRALFNGFDDMYGDISYALGRAAAQAMQVQDL